MMTYLVDTWYDQKWWGALCTCTARAHVLHLFFVLPPLQVKRWAPLMPEVQVRCLLSQPICLFWVPFVCGAGCARQDRKSLFERGPPVLGNFELSTPNLVHWRCYSYVGSKVNFELATPNSIHGCTLARPTWRRMENGARVHSARAVHVQVF